LEGADVEDAKLDVEAADTKLTFYGAQVSNAQANVRTRESALLEAEIREGDARIAALEAGDDATQGPGSRHGLLSKLRRD
jgi:hypothetical protein